MHVSSSQSNTATQTDDKTHTECTTERHANVLAMQPHCSLQPFGQFEKKYKMLLNYLTF